MTPFTPDHMMWLRVYLKRGYPMSRICHLWDHTRDEIVEAIDASRRCPDVESATAHVNRVLDLQDRGYRLINGNPVTWTRYQAHRVGPKLPAP